ncbi:hypothetical protein BGZ60DRAFT_499633 [Tricladium varicosporioides]|nr:hypothetical protein BGZ60DRAFT_499633 [Hymenoscyphus varicosporioides]
MAISIQAVSVADTPRLARTMMGAWYGDPHWLTLWVRLPALGDLIYASEERLPWNLINGDKSKRYQKAIDTATGEVVGYARWVLPPILAEKGSWEEAHLLVDEISSGERLDIENRFKAVTENGKIKGLDHAQLDFRNRPLEEADARIIQNGPFLVLDYLAVLPAFQRRGIATMLVRSGLRIADINNLKSYVMASPAGLKMYLDQGFEIVETVSQDYSEYGGTSLDIHHFMVRLPVFGTEANNPKSGHQDGF